MLLAAGWLASVAAAADQTLSISLKDGLLFQDNRGAKSRTSSADLQLDVALRDSKPLDHVWAFTELLPGQEHLGRIIDATIEPEQIQLRVRLQINHNRNSPMALGGQAEFSIVLKREEESFVGSHTGTCAALTAPDVLEAIEAAWGYGLTPGKADHAQPTVRNKATTLLATGQTRGTATASLKPAINLDLSKARLGDHPRLLFCKADLPALRQRAQTPEGQKIIAQLKDLLQRADEHGFAYQPPAAEHSMGNIWAVGHALLYQLTGDKTHAQRAAQLCHANLYGNYYYGGWWIHAYTIMGIAFSYDMCAEAWDDQTRQIMYSFLEQNARHLAMRHDALDLLGTSERFSFANEQTEFELRSVRDAYHNKFRAAAAIGALAILHDPPPVYRPPDLASVPVIEPADDYEPWIGVPVEPFENDIMPRQWLINGPFLRGSVDQAFKPVGGLGSLRPEPGTTVQSDGTPVDFRIYRPAGWSKTHGGMIYARDCSRYWASATGGGYNPGIALMKKWREQAGKNVSINVCLYTVIDNDRERIVQALPNWRSRSIGNRMWIGGTQVRDGQLVRLKKGLYPLMVDVAVIGAYSGQAPKLREYTPQIHAMESAACDRATAALASEDPQHNELLRNAHALVRSVQRDSSSEVGADGWRAWEAQETLLPLLLALRNATGADLAKDTPIANLLPLAVRLRGHSGDRAFDYMVSQGVAFMPAEHRPIARWYLDRYGLGIRRPLDAAIALSTHHFTEKPRHPRESFKLAGMFANYGIHCFRSGWEGSGDVLTMIETGDATHTSPYVAGNLTLHGLGRAWICARSGDDFADANNLSIREIYPTRHASVLHTSYAADGSGALSFDLTGLRAGKLIDEKKMRIDFAAGDPGIAIRRAFAVDYSGASGSPALLVIVDRVGGAAFREKTWRYDLGDIHEPGRPNDGKHGLFTRPTGFLVRPRPNSRLPDVPDGANMNVTILAPAKLEFVERSYGEGRRTILEAKLERHLSRMEKAVNRNPDPGGKLPGDDPLLEELQQDDHENQRKRLAPITVFTIVTLQTGEPPKVSSTGEGDARIITVGKRIIRFDGQKVVLSQ